MFTGCGTAMVTPFNEDLSLDESTLRKLIRRQIEADHSPSSHKSLLFHHKMQIKVSLYRVWSEHLAEALTHVLEIIFSEILQQRTNPWIVAGRRVQQEAGGAQERARPRRQPIAPRNGGVILQGREQGDGLPEVLIGCRAG